MFKKVKSVFSSRHTRYATIAVLVIVILAIAGIAALIHSSRTPKNVYWDAINNNFMTSAVTIQGSQSSGNTQENQNIQIDMGQHPAVRTITVLTSSTGKVKTEDLNTPSAEFTRYLYISSNRKAKNGKPINFGSVIGLWSKTSNNGSGNKLPPNLGQIMLGLSLPFGNLTISQRSQLINQIQDFQTYTTNFNDVSRSTLNGQPVYKYKVSIQPLLYVRFLKTYASFLGLHQLDNVNPNSYGGQPNLHVTWTVNVNSKHLVAAQYGSNHVESYSGYGIPVTEKIPTHTVTATQLQKQLTDLLNQ